MARLGAGAFMAAAQTIPDNMEKPLIRSTGHSNPSSKFREGLNRQLGRLVTSRVVAFLLAASVAVVTVSFLSLIEGTPPLALLVTAALSFSSSFLLVYFTMEFLIFKEVNDIYTSLDKITRKELQYYSVKNNNVSANPLRRINQEIRTYVTRKEKEIDKLKKLEVYRKEFIADISHELKTPIFAAQGYVLTLLDGAIDDEKVKYKFLKKAAKSLNGLDAVVQDLLTLSQIESGVIIMRYGVFEVQAIVQDVFEQLESKAEKKSIELRLTRYYPEGIYVNADINRITQVFTNLVSNAIKYGKPGGWVEVDLEEGNKFVKISVKDNGPGIPEEHLERVFERFYRVDKSRSKKQGGTGLGLAIVKHILEGHKSKITVSNNLDVGANFSFKLQKGAKEDA